MLPTREPELRRYWYPVAFAEDATTTLLARRLLGEDLVVWIDDAGRPGAALDRCPHRGARVSGGWRSATGCAVCPYHGWEYGVDGRAVRIPQLEPGVPIPPKARLRAAHAAVHVGLVWVALEEPVLPLPEVPGWGEEGHRVVREFDEVWAASAFRLVDNSFDPAHIAFVHRASFGDVAKARFDTPRYERTADGLVMEYELEVVNPEVAWASTGSSGAVTTRRTVNRYHAPIVRVMSITYPRGPTHTLFTASTPVDDEHLRLLQFAVRNDSEAEAPAERIVAFDRQVTEEDRALLESTDPDFALDPTDNVHIKVDRTTLEIRRILSEIVAGAPTLAAATVAR